MTGAPPHPVIGVLALQGDFAAHARALRDAGAAIAEVRLSSDLEGVAALVIPGGESTTLRLLLAERGLGPALGARVQAGMPVLGTCAGAIVLAHRIENPAAAGLGLIDVDVERNAFGRQVDSFIATADPGPPPFGGIECVFIRAPRFSRIGPGVTVLARLRGEPILVRQGSVLAATFHPELSADRTLHRTFAALVGPVATAAAAS